MADQPIHLAALEGDLSELQRLITEDPSLVELRNQYGYTPLVAAAEQGHAAIVSWLIDDAGADIDAQSLHGYNGLFVSGINGHLEVVSILLNRGADINRADNDGWSPLIIAAASGGVGVMEILLSYEGIDLDAQTGLECTALWNASSNGREELVRVLLAAGADPRIASNDGETPLDAARREGHDGCIRLLEAALAEAERVHVLHKARAMNDACHAADKVASETEGRTRGERKRKMVAKPPAYLKRRVGEGRELPQVKIMQSSRNAEEEEEKLAAVVEHMVIDGQVPSEVFVELMKMMIPKWDDERRV